MRSRRLVGPTIFALILCGLLADHLFFGGSRWSVTRFLGKFLGALSTVIAPPSSPAFYNWLNSYWLPIFLLLLALGLLLLVFTGAKRAMSKASGEISAAPPRKTAAAAPMQAAAEAQEGQTPSAPRHVFLGRLVPAIGIMLAAFGIVVCATVQHFLSSTVERQARERAAAMALGLREIVGPVLRNRESDMTAALEKYAARNPVVYLYVEDAAGRVVAHWPSDLLRYLRRDFPRSSERALTGVDGDYRSERIYGIASRAAGGDSGFVHLAIDMSSVAAAVRRTIIMIAGAFLLLSLCAVGALVWIVRSLQSPWSELVEQAGRISRGDFAVPLALQRGDEIGEIARSLERMRSSLRAVTARLEQGLTMRHSNE